MKHILRCILQALRHPAAGARGAWEFRRDLTWSHDNESIQESYDSGRELAHWATFRHWEQS